MNNRVILMLMLIALLFSACGSNSSWEQEEVVVSSNRIMAEMVEAKWSLEEGSLIRIEIQKNNGEPMEDFEVNHEKLLHLIIVSKNLSYFNHIHPEYKGGGVFEIENDFPAGGQYRLIADFKPVGGDSMTKMEWIQVEGVPATDVPMAKELTLVDVADGKRASLSIEGLGVNRETALTFTVEDASTGEPVTDLEPYLGAIGHVVVLSEGGERYVHVHAEEDQGTGPEAQFETSFPKAGIYKLWGQFQQNGQVFTVSYTVIVQESVN
jgi:hypothetical protein